MIYLRIRKQVNNVVKLRNYNDNLMLGNETIGYWQRRGKWNRYKNVASFKLCE